MKGIKLELLRIGFSFAVIHVAMYLIIFVGWSFIQLFFLPYNLPNIGFFIGFEIGTIITSLYIYKKVRNELNWY